MWKDAYLLGVDQIDQQHKQLVGALTGLLRAKGQPEKAGAECQQTMDFLKSYVVNHFLAEEMLQEQIGFPEAEEHHRMHEAFKAMLHEHDLALMRTGYDEERVDEMARMLTRWFIYHIVREDRKMMEYLLR